MASEMKVFFCRNATLEPLMPTLEKAAATEDWTLKTELSGYSDFEAQALNPASTMARFEPDLVWVWLEVNHLHEAFWYEFSSFSREDVEQIEATLAERVEGFLNQLGERYSVPVVVQNFAPPAYPALGLAENHSEHGQWAVIRRLNHRLKTLCAGRPSFYLFDFERFCSRAGLDGRINPKHWYLSNLALSASYFPAYAAEWVRTVKAIKGKRRKCLALDLDNTLWQGIIGEDGLTGIRLGGAYPGNAFQDFQKAILNLYYQGVLMAVCSKNNERDAWEVFDKHPEMVLKRDHLAAYRINWIDKVTNLRDLAAELNIGLDSFVFLDDNPKEREWVKSQLPEVLVPDFPAEPFQLPGFLLSLDAFDTFRFSEEDRKRTQYYAQQQKRTSVQKQAASLDDYLRSLDLTLEIDFQNAANRGRLAQLTQKTNQFNILTRRYTEGEMDAFLAQNGQIVCGRVKDRFGDNGIIILCMLKQENDTAEFENFLMSCRVIGLTVEQAFFAWIAGHLEKKGIRRVEGRFLPTAKNGLASDFYERMGFSLVEGTKGEESLWELRLPGGPSIPDWFTVKTPGEEPKGSAGRPSESRPDSGDRDPDRQSKSMESDTHG